MGNITGALIENAFHPPENSDHSSDSPPLDVKEELKRIARDSSNRELYRLLHAKMEQSALDRAAAAAVAAHHAPNLNSEAGCGDGGAGKKWESSGRRASGEEQRCGSASSGGRGGGGGENALLSSECGSGGGSADVKTGGLSSKPEQDGVREAPRMGFFKKQLLKSYWTENEDASTSAAPKTDPSAAAVPDGEKDAGKKGEAGGVAEASGKDGATIAVDGRLLSTDLKAELFGDSDAAKPRTKLMNINTCIEVIVMNELKKLDSVPDDLPTGRQMPLFATLEASRTRPTENRGNELARVNTGGGNRSAVESGWPLRSESGGRATADSEPKREKWPQYVNVDAVLERAPSEFSPQQSMGRKSTDVGGGGTRNAPSSGYHRGSGGGYPPETTNITQEVPRMYTSSGDNNTARSNTRLTNQFGETGVDTISHGGGPVVKYSPSNAWSRDISPAQSSPHVMMSSGDSSGFKVMPSSSSSQQQQQQQQLPSMPMLDQRRKPERDSEPSKYQQQAEYLSYVNQQQQYHNVSNLNEQHSAAAYQNCPPVLQDKLHASDLGHYGYPTKNPRERGVHAGQFESSSFGNHPETLQPPLANYIKHSPKNSPILAYERDGTARPLGPPEPQYHHRPDQPQQYHPRNDPTQQYHHRSDQTQYHRSEQLMKSQPGSLMAGSARSYRMVGDQPHPPQQQQQAPQPPAPQVYYRSSDRQTRGELVAMVDKKGFPSSYQGPPPTEEYVERRMKRPSASSSSSSSGTTRGGEMGNVSVGLDHHQQQQQQQQQQQPTLRSHSISYPTRGGGGRGGGEVTEKGGHWGHSSEETPLDLTVKKEFPDTHHHHPSAVYHLPPSMKQQQQQQADWGAVARGVGYRPSYGGEEDPLGARLMTRATTAPQKNPDFPTMPEMQRREMVDMRSVVYDKLPSGLQQQQQQVQHHQPESEMGRMVPTPSAAANDRTMSMRTSVIASHPFDDNPSSLAPPPLHLTMQQLSEALTKTSTQHSIGGATWKQSPYATEMVPRSRAHTLDPEPSSRLTIDATSRQERPRPRPNNSSTANNDLLHLATTSPTIPHLSPVQPLVSTAASSQAPGGSNRRAPGPSLLGSHSPSDILHLQCKVCGSTYGSLRSFRMHFAKVHGLEPLPEHCNISTISGTKNAMSKVPMEDSEPPALQRETMLTDVGKNRGGFDSFGNPARPTKPDILRVEPVPTNIRTKQVAEVYPMPARTSRGLSPQLKAEGSAAASGWRTAELTELHAEQSEGQIKVGGDVKNSSRLVNCDLGIFRSRNCYSDLGCDRDTDCPECLDGFKDISDWKMHISTHMMRSCTCKPCNLSFTHSGALKKHLHAVHAHVDKVEVEYRCLFCREAFSDEKVLFYHTQEHEKRYSRLDNTRRDSISSSSLSFKAPGGGGNGGADPDCIQMAVPDTTCSDDARPTSEFGGESSSNVSPSSFPGVDSKGSGGSSTESKVDPAVTLDDVGVVDKKLKIGGEMELGYKQRAMLLRGGLDSSSDQSRSSELSRLDAVAAASQLLYRSHGGIPHGLKSDDRELLSGESGKLDAKFSFDIGEECRQFKPTTVTPPKAVVVEETSTFVWKKQAVLKRVQSGESRDAIDTDPNAATPADKPSPVSSRAASSASRSSGGAGGASAEKSPSEVSQPMHLRDLFSMMGHQVEKSIWGIPDFPQFNSAPAARGSRCVRDVCDEIIALSFREESSPRDPLPGPPGSDKPDNISKTKVSEQLKILVNPDHHDTRPPELMLPETRPNPEGLYGGASWTRSPCSSRDSCHSLEIDESGFNRDSAEGERLESTDSEPPRSLYGDPVVESTSPRRDYTRKESTEEDGKHPVVEDLAKVAFGGRGHRGRDDEGSMVRHSETFYGRRPSSEGPPPSGDSAPTTMSRTKDVGSPPSSSSKQEASADGDDGKASESSIPVVGTKRKHVSGGGKETGDAAVADEPPLKKSAPS